MPAVAVLLHAGEDGVLQLLVLSQVVLSLQLPFAILPLIRFTSAKSIMGSFASPTWLRYMAYSAAFLIIALNAWLVVQALGPTGALASSEGGRIVWGLVALFCGVLLVWIAFSPLRLTDSDTASPQKSESVIHRVAEGSVRAATDGTLRLR